MPLLAVALANLPEIIAAGQSLWSLVESIKTAAHQTGEWTADHEAQYQAGLLKMGEAPESQPDAPAVAAAAVATPPVAETVTQPAPEPPVAAAVAETAAPVTDQTVTPPASPATVASPAPAPEVASTDPSVCQVCGKVTVPDSTTNCNCAPA